MAPDNPCCALKILTMTWEALGRRCYKIFTSTARGGASCMFLPGMAAITLPFTAPLPTHAMVAGDGCAQHERGTLMAIDFGNAIAEDDDPFCSDTTFATIDADDASDLASRHQCFLDTVSPALAAASYLWCDALINGRTLGVISGVTHVIMVITHASDVPPGIYRLYCEKPIGCYKWFAPVLTLPKKVVYPIPSPCGFSVLFVKKKNGAHGPDELLMSRIGVDSGMTDGMRSMLRYLGVTPHTDTKIVTPRFKIDTMSLCTMILETAMYHVELAIDSFATLDDIAKTASFMGHYETEYAMWSAAMVDQKRVLMNMFCGLLYDGAGGSYRDMCTKLGVNYGTVNSKIAYTPAYFKRRSSTAPVLVDPTKIYAINFLTRRSQHITLPPLQRLANLEEGCVAELCFCENELLDLSSIPDRVTIDPLSVQIVNVEPAPLELLTHFIDRHGKKLLTDYRMCENKPGAMMAVAIFTAAVSNGYYLQLIGFNVRGGALLCMI